MSQEGVSTCQKDGARLQRSEGRPVDRIPDKPTPCINVQLVVYERQEGEQGACTEDLSAVEGGNEGTQREE